MHIKVLYHIAAYARLPSSLHLFCVLGNDGEVRGEMNDHYSLLLFSSLMEMNRHKREVAKEAEDKVLGRVSTR